MIERRRSAIDMIEVVRNALAFILVIAFIGAMGAFTVWIIPETNKDILTYMVGQLSGMATTALGFYFVSKVGQDALDAKRAENTGRLAEAVTSALAVGPGADAAANAAGEVAEAAINKRDDIQGATP